MPRTVALVLWPVSLLLVFGTGPIVVASLSRRIGWAHGRPAAANLIGVVPVVAGAALMVWVLAGHYRATPAGWDLGRGLGPAARPEYLLRGGAYARSRNPLYLAEQSLVFGWAVLLGSIPVGVLLVLLAAGQIRVVRFEERRLEAEFGNAFRDYMRSVPRWLRIRPRSLPRARGRRRRR